MVSETRITTYLGIAKKQIPGSAYYQSWRTFPPDWTWPEMPPVGAWRRHLGLKAVPGWGGSMFEALMPNVFVPEERWAPRSWGRNHPRHVDAQIHHGLQDAGYGYWGFSPASEPYGGYAEWGVDALGLNPELKIQVRSFHAVFRRIVVPLTAPGAVTGVHVTIA